MSDQPRNAVRPESLPVPEGKTERRELRSANSKTFIHPDKAEGKEIRTCEVRMGAVCYRDDTGEMRSIDTTIRDIDGAMGVDWAPYRFRLHADDIGFDFESREGGTASLSLKSVGGNQPKRAEPIIADNRITFPEVSPGVDIVFICLNERVKTLRIVKDSKAAREFTWSCVSDKPELIDATLIGTDAAGRALELTAKIDGETITETWSGKTVVRDQATRIKSLSDEVTYPVEIDPTVSYEVGATADDGVEMQEFGGFYTGICYFGHNSTLTYHPGWRFTGVAVDKDATITSATLTIRATAIVGSGGAGSLKGWLTANPGAFNSTNKPTAVPKTTASTTVAAIGTTGLKDIDATAIVQELVNQASWASGNAMALPLISTSTGNNKTFIEDFAAAGTDEGLLSITYAAAGGDHPAMSRFSGVPGMRLGGASFGRGW